MVHYLDAGVPDGTRLYAIGDVHGRADLLTRMHDMIAQEAARDRPDRTLIIHIGDYVDRGPDSAAVLDFLAGRCAADSDTVALLGNHDLGLLEYLDNPLGAWLFVGYGGAETVRSYGVEPDFSSESGLVETAKTLAETMPRAHRDFLAGLPRSSECGDFYLCHAGIRPGVPLAEQDPEDLIWIRREFLDCATLHPKVIVHGHTPHGAPEVLANRVNVDTRAYASGLLTALVVEGRQKRFLEARE